MDILEEIYKENEYDEKGYEDIYRYEQILNQFLEKAKISFPFDVVGITGNPFTKFRLFHIDYIYTSSYIDLYFSILSKYNYNMKYEIRDAMFFLGSLSNPKDNREIISKYLKSPVIQDISYDGKGTYTIFSEQYGKFIFTLASYYYRKNNIIANYLKHEILPQNCHEHTYFMAKILGDEYAVTSLCPSFFLGETFYHSYTYVLDENIIIDLCHNAIINKDLYYKLFAPKEISIILNRKVNSELQIVEGKLNQSNNNMCQLMKIALYKQYLKSINYRGSLENAPTLKKKIF